MYIHQQADWPHLIYTQAALVDALADVRHLQGKLLGHMESLGFAWRAEATLATLTQDVIKTSQIEGETLDLQQVRSSIAQKLGLDIGHEPVAAARNVEGIVEVMLDATRHYNAPMTKERLFDWHAALFPTGRSGMQRIAVGQWRTEASGLMQVVSGAIGREKVHYEAPPHACLDNEMTAFLAWFNAESTTDLVLRAAIAHFWFVTIHPFEDGNGRIARALADMMLARSEASSQRFYSMSAQIQRERNAYYTILEGSQKGSLNITAWLEWFLGCLKRAIQSAQDVLQTVRQKANFWQQQGHQSINPRQRNMINRLLDGGFEGKLTSSKYAKISKCSQDTALRDITDLVEKNILHKDDAGGRSVGYALRLPASSEQS